MELISRYAGNDWKNIYATEPFSLFRNDHMELMLMNWKSNKCAMYYNNYSTVHTKVLEGSFELVETIGGRVYKPNRKIMHLSEGHLHTFFPFSRIYMTAQGPSTTLQLHYMQYIN